MVTKIHIRHVVVLFVMVSRGRENGPTPPTQRSWSLITGKRGRGSLLLRNTPSNTNRDIIHRVP